MSLIKLKIATKPRMDGNICIRIKARRPGLLPLNLSLENA